MYKELVKNKIKELELIVKEKWPSISLPEITVKYNLNSVRSLGMVNPTTGVMRLNESLLNEFGEKYINEVVVHEFAHVVVQSMFPFGYHKLGNSIIKIKPHGREFKMVCREFGISGKATTSLFKDSEELKSKKRKTRRFEYSCNCSTHFVSTRMHNILQKPNHGRVCGKCQGSVSFVKEVS